MQKAVGDQASQLWADSRSLREQIGRLFDRAQSASGRDKLVQKLPELDRAFPGRAEVDALYGQARDWELWTALPDHRQNPIRSTSRQAQKPVFHALLEARDSFGGATPALVDGDGRALTYDEIIRASFALGDALKKGTRARRACRRDAAHRARAPPSPSSRCRPMAGCRPC